MLENVQWPDEFPYTAEDFRRYDESPDTFFYVRPLHRTSDGRCLHAHILCSLAVSAAST